MKFIQIMLNKKSALFKLSCEVHIINNLSVNMLINTDILDSHEIIINVVKNQIIINIC